MSLWKTGRFNLRMVYETALGEIPQNIDSLSLLSPAIFLMEQLGYFLEAATHDGGRVLLTKDEAARFIYFFETMTQSIEQQQLVETFDRPNIPQHSRIHKTVSSLQETLALFLNQRAKI